MGIHFIYFKSPLWDRQKNKIKSHFYCTSCEEISKNNTIYISILSMFEWQYACIKTYQAGIDLIHF